jgi:hypothetical protein
MSVLKILNIDYFADMQDRAIFLPENDHIFIGDQASYFFDYLLPCTFVDGFLELRMIVVEEELLSFVLRLEEDLLLCSALFIEHAVEDIHDDVAGEVFVFIF